MQRKTLILVPLAVLLATAIGSAYYLLGKQPVRDGKLATRTKAPKRQAPAA